MCCLPTRKEKSSNATGRDTENNFIVSTKAVTNGFVHKSLPCTSQTVEKEKTSVLCKNCVNDVFVSCQLFWDFLNVFHVLLKRLQFVVTVKCELFSDEEVVSKMCPVADRDGHFWKVLKCITGLTKDAINKKEPIVSDSINGWVRDTDEKVFTNCVLKVVPKDFRRG